MITLSDNLILINNEIKTRDILQCRLSEDATKYHIIFKGNHKTYTYGKEKILWLRDPEVLDPRNYHISRRSESLTNIVMIRVFRKAPHSFWQIGFSNGKTTDYREEELVISKSVLGSIAAENVFNYLRSIAAENPLGREKGISLLEEQYNRLNFIPEDSVLATYLNPINHILKKDQTIHLIYPFGCNASQKKAVEAAFANQTSVIQGPPGTGKTQTILNIVANILIQGKTVQIVSNNNSAIRNVQEKLTSLDMGFVIAFLGNKLNKETFCDRSPEERAYPATMSLWKSTFEDESDFLEQLHLQTELLGDIFSRQENLARLKQELHDVKLEWEHYRRDIVTEFIPLHARRTIRSQQLISILSAYKNLVEGNTGTGFSLSAVLRHVMEVFLFLKCRLLLRIGDNGWYKKGAEHILLTLQTLFYRTRIQELLAEIEELEHYLKIHDAVKQIETVTANSMLYLKSKLYERYGSKRESTQFSMEELKSNWKVVLKEYPVILSTTFSSRMSLHEDTVYDYLIMDEASQVSVETGALALSVAKNAVIVGDTLQLPNVINEPTKKIMNGIMRTYGVASGYDCANQSFLESVCKVMPNLPQTLLREHYRCHPRIINFCNQKFYGGNLLIMTHDKQEKDVIWAIKTGLGKYERNSANQREIDIINQEILPELKYPDEKIGIITPFNNQVNALKEELSRDIEAATVHKFQGMEKDVIIMSTVEDVVSSFTDNANLLNVAVSRAKHRFCLIVSDHEQPEGNISDLIAYIRYNNCMVSNSKVRSVFDYLYGAYTEQRIAYLKAHPRISRYDSENLTYALLRNVLQNNQEMVHLDIICHQSLRMLISDFSVLDEEERKYAMHASTHLDFLIYNRVSKQPVLAVETDGYAFHKPGSLQYERDRKKDRILDVYGIPLIRLSTTGSNEQQRIEERLSSLLS